MLDVLDGQFHPARTRDTALKERIGERREMVVKQPDIRINRSQGLGDGRVRGVFSICRQKQAARDNGTERQRRC